MINVLQHKYVQLLLAVVVVFGLLIMVGINVTLTVGSSGAHFSIDRKAANE